MWGVEQEQERSDVRAAGTVCAHIGCGADDDAAKVARDRLTKVLAHYRKAFVTDQDETAPV